MLLDALSTVEGRGIKVSEDQREKIEEAVALLEEDGGVQVPPLPLPGAHHVLHFFSEMRHAHSRDSDVGTAALHLCSICEK